ncbi:MAG: 4Fe-4S binding protein [Prolixibacteraceae bacterium]|jgi:ferredoxin|nr:4Fe-4S binding protein [Prolixibacteraceae bacterium]
MRGQGMNRQQGKGRSDGRGMNAHGVVCACTHCAYTREHIPGVPCRDSICPNCGDALVKVNAARQIVSGNHGFQATKMRSTLHDEVGETYINQSETTKQAIHKISRTDNNIPMVETDKCTGCGTCVEVCKRNAITLVKYHRSFVNCGLCVLKCPRGAIAKFTL